MSDTFTIPELSARQKQSWTRKLLRLANDKYGVEDVEMWELKLAMVQRDVSHKTPEESAAYLWGTKREEAK